VTCYCLFHQISKMADDLIRILDFNLKKATPVHSDPLMSSLSTNRFGDVIFGWWSRKWPHAISFSTFNL